MSTFADQVTFSTSPNRQQISVVAADFDGDGKPDIATVNYADNNVSVLLSNGNGTFKAQATLAAGTGPSAIASADFNGNGANDLVVSDAGQNNISVYLGNGNGTFGARATFATGGLPYYIATGKTTTGGAGNVDIAVSCVNVNQISVLLGNGDGTFKAQATYATGVTPQGVVLADLNGDTKLDMLVANNGGSSISVWLGNGNGTFQTATAYTTIATPNNIAVGDVDGDGKLDLVVCGNGTTISVLIGNGNGTFQAHKTYNAAKSYGIGLSDFDNDGKLDLVLADNTNNLLCLYLGNGNGTFKSAETHATGTNPRGLAVADFSSDSIPDVVVGNQAVASTFIDYFHNLTVPTGPATAYTASPASTILAASGTTVFTFTPNGLSSATVTPTPSAGSFSPATITFDGTAAAKTSTYTAPATTQVVTVSYANSASLTNPANTSLTVHTYLGSITPTGWWTADALTLFTDAGGTTPVASDGDLIAVWKDASPSGYNLTQSTTAKKLKWDAINSMVQCEYSALEGMDLPTIASISGKNFTLIIIGEIVTLRDGTDSTHTNFTDMYFMDGNADGVALSFHRGGLLQTWDGVAVRQSTAKIMHTGRSMIAYSCGGSGTTVYVDGSSDTLTVMGTSSFTGGQLLTPNAYTKSGQMAVKDILLYNSALSAGQIAAVLADAQALRGVAATTTGLCAFDGDSETSGAGNTMNRNWPRQLTLRNTIKRINFAESALQMQTMVTERATLVDPFILAGKTNTLFVFAGTNDLALGARTAAQVYADTKTYCAAAKTAGWNKVVILGMLPRAAIETSRQTVRTDFLGDFTASSGFTLTYGPAGGVTYADYYVDLGGDANIGAANANTNTTYYNADQIHLNNTGSSYLASTFVQPMANAFFPSSGGSGAVGIGIGIGLGF